MNRLGRANVLVFGTVLAAMLRIVSCGPFDATSEGGSSGGRPALPYGGGNGLATGGAIELPFAGRTNQAGGSSHAAGSAGNPTDAAVTGGACGQSVKTKVTATWKQELPSRGGATDSVQPPPRGYHAIAAGRIDSSSVVLMFGGGNMDSGVLADTWMFDPFLGGWTQLKGGPPARGGLSLSFMDVAMGDASAAGAFVLFGGQGNKFFGDTWIFEDGNWSSLCSGDAKSCSCGPCARAYHAAAYDSARQQVVLFGGRDATDSMGDTWVFSSSGSWTERCQASCSGNASTCCVAPTRRSEHAMAFDPFRDVAVLFGGKDVNGTLLGDTWEWDGVRWTERTSKHTPSARSGHAMATAPGSNGVVLFGGVDSQDEAARVLWLWDGTDWQVVESAAEPPASRAFGAMATEDSGFSSVLFGGGSAGDLGDTWSIELTRQVVAVDHCAQTDAGTADAAEIDAGSASSSACKRLALCCATITDEAQKHSCGLYVTQDNSADCKTTLESFGDGGLCR